MAVDPTRHAHRVATRSHPGTRADGQVRKPTPTPHGPRRGRARHGGVGDPYDPFSTPSPLTERRGLPSGPRRLTPRPALTANAAEEAAVCRETRREAVERTVESLSDLLSCRRGSQSYHILSHSITGGRMRRHCVLDVLRVRIGESDRTDHILSLRITIPPIPRSFSDASRAIVAEIYRDSARRTNETRRDSTRFARIKVLAFSV